MSNFMKLVIALALTGVTPTGALAASRHRGVHPRAYSGYAYVPAYNAYPNLGPPTLRRGYAAQAYGKDAEFNPYNGYIYLGP